MEDPSALPQDLGPVSEAELSDLRRKFQLLEGDRKAYYEISMKQMKENKALISKLRDSNKSMRVKLKQARKANSKVTDVNGEEVSKVEKHVGIIRRNLDTVRAQVVAKRKELEALRDRAEELKMEGTSADPTRPTMGTSSNPAEIKRIRVLENRLDRSIIKYNEAQSIRVTYEQIVERLKEERDGFDSQLRAVERTIAVKDKDMEELMTLAGGAQQAKDSMSRDLARAQEKLDRDRKERDKELRRKRQVAESTKNLLASVQNMNKTRANIFGRMGTNAGSLTQSEEDLLRDGGGTGTRENGQDSNRPGDATAVEWDEYEVGFSKIMRISGVKDVNQIIAKILSQTENRKNLQDLIDENSGKIEEKQAQVTRARTILEEMRFTGMNRGGVTTRKRLDEMEEAVLQATSSLEYRKKQQDGLSQTILGAQAGIKHLMDKTRPLRPPDTKFVALNRDTLVQALEQCEQVLVQALARMNEAGSSQAAWGEGSSTLDLMRHPRELDESELLAFMPNNRRVRLSSDDRRGQKILRIANHAEEEEAGDADEDSLSLLSDEEDETDPNDPSDPISRAHIKHASRVLLRQRSPRQGAKQSSTATPSIGSKASPTRPRGRASRVEKQRRK